MDRCSATVVADYSVRYFRADCGDADIEPMRIPDELLEYVDPRAESVREYRGVGPSTTQSEPTKSTSEGHLGPAGEGPRVSENREVEGEGTTEEQTKIAEESDSDSKKTISDAANVMMTMMVKALKMYMTSVILRMNSQYHSILMTSSIFQTRKRRI